MKTYIITGATGGLGLWVGQYLAKNPENQVIFAVRDINRAKQLTASIDGNIQLQELDLSSLQSVDAFVSSWHGKIDGLLNIAGVQIVSGLRLTTPERLEETFVVNHLAPLKLTLGLLPNMNSGRVLFVGSATHHPKNPIANIFGFRGAQFQSIDQCSKGQCTREQSPPRQHLKRSTDIKSTKSAGLDRYATSKFLNMVTTIELARRIPPDQARFFCLDPGLMPGTGLARTESKPLQFAWNNLLPILSKILPDSSTPQRSAKVATLIMEDPAISNQRSTIFSFDGKPLKNIWGPVLDKKIGKIVIDDSINLLDSFGNKECRA